MKCKIAVMAQSLLTVFAITGILLSEAGLCATGVAASVYYDGPMAGLEAAVATLMSAKSIKQANRSAVTNRPGEQYVNVYYKRPSDSSKQNGFEVSASIYSFQPVPDVAKGRKEAQFRAFSSLITYAEDDRLHGVSNVFYTENTISDEYQKIVWPQGVGSSMTRPDWSKATRDRESGAYIVPADASYLAWTRDDGVYVYGCFGNVFVMASVRKDRDAAVPVTAKEVVAAIFSRMRGNAEQIADSDGALSWAVAPLAPAKRGDRIELHFRGQDNSALANFEVIVYQHGNEISQDQSSALKLFRQRATGSEDYKVPYTIGVGKNIKGPLYFCVVARNADGKSAMTQESCAWIPVIVPIEDVSNGCGGAQWGAAFATVQNWFLNERSYLGIPGASDALLTAPGQGGLRETFPVSFKEACDLHDAGYAGLMVEDKLNGRVTDFRTWTRQDVDNKFLMDMRAICERDIGNKSREATNLCAGSRINLDELIEYAGAGDYYWAVREYASGAFDYDLTQTRSYTQMSSTTGDEVSLNSTWVGQTSSAAAVISGAKRIDGALATVRAPAAPSTTAAPALGGAANRPETQSAASNAPPAPAPSPAPPAAAQAPMKAVQDVLDTANKLKDVFRGFLGR